MARKKMRTVNLKKLRGIGAKKHLLIISLGAILMIAVFSISISNEIAKLNLEYDLEDGNFWYYKSSKNRTIKKALFDDNSLSLSYREKRQQFSYQNLDTIHYYISNNTGHNFIYLKNSFSRQFAKFKILKSAKKIKLIPKNSLAKKSEGMITLFK
ncbi:hypothetical protein FCS82_08940 [Oenococcus sp. UCMA 14587]|nr:hypothetical protein [Oenococcus sp. UCMA 14587]